MRKLIWAAYLVAGLIGASTADAEEFRPNIVGLHRVDDTTVHVFIQLTDRAEQGFSVTRNGLTVVFVPVEYKAL